MSLRSVSFIQILFLQPITLLYQNCGDNNLDDCQNHGWSLPGEVYECNGNLIIGNYGYDEIVEKFFIIPPHKLMRFSVTIYKIDSWDMEGFDISANNELIQKIYLDHYAGIENLCGNPGYHDEAVQVEKEFSLTDFDFTVKLQGHLDQPLWDESWGFRNTIIETLIPCVNFYSECDYQGELFQICKGDQTKLQSEIPFEIRSINLNNNTIVKLRGPQYEDGTTQQYMTSQPCLNSYKVKSSNYQVSQNTARRMNEKDISNKTDKGFMEILYNQEKITFQYSSSTLFSENIFYFNLHKILENYQQQKNVFFLKFRNLFFVLINTQDFFPLQYFFRNTFLNEIKKFSIKSMKNNK